MNLKQILSKSSLRSSTSSGKSFIQADQNKKIQDEYDALKLNVLSLKVLLDNKDEAIATLAREKEKLYVELKNLQRTNRNLEEVLINEREMHSKEKNRLIENMKRFFIKLSNSGKLDATIDEEEYIKSLKNEIKSKDEVICNVCSKYLKIKKSKQELLKRFKSLQKYTQQTFENVITTLEDNKNSLYILVEELRKSAKSSPSHKQYLKMIKQNANLNFENTQLKVLLYSKNKYDAKDDKKELKISTSAVTTSKCLYTDEEIENINRIAKQRPVPCCRQQFGHHSKINSSKIFTIFSKPKNIIAYKCDNICDRSMSDTVLPNKFYK